MCDNQSAAFVRERVRDLRQSHREVREALAHRGSERNRLAPALREPLRVVTWIHSSVMPFPLPEVDFAQRVVDLERSDGATISRVCTQRRIGLTRQRSKGNSAACGSARTAPRPARSSGCRCARENVRRIVRGRAVPAEDDRARARWSRARIARIETS